MAPCTPAPPTTTPRSACRWPCSRRSPAYARLVLEMAMRGPGQISELCEIAPPEVGVITNVGPVHLELLGTVEAVAEAKAELIAALPRERRLRRAGGGGGAAPAPAPRGAHAHLRRLAAGRWRRADRGRVGGGRCGRRARAERGARRGRRPRGPAGRDRRRGGARNARVQLPQAHNLVNALAAIGAAHALGVPLDSARPREPLRSASRSLRGEEIELPDGALLVINDCYNANPISMRAALDHLAQVVARATAAARVAVLGEMAELGPAARTSTARSARTRPRLGVASLVAVGDLARRLRRGLRRRRRGARSARRRRRPPHRARADRAGRRRAGQGLALGRPRARRAGAHEQARVAATAAPGRR